MPSQWCLFPRDRVSMVIGAGSLFTALCPSRGFDFSEVCADRLDSIRNLGTISKILCVSFNFGVSTKQLHEEHYGY